MDSNKDTYKPVVPDWVADILDYKKNKGHRSATMYPSGQLRKDWDDWKYRYTRKHKYAKLNGYIRESEVDTQ